MRMRRWDERRREGDGLVEVAYRHHAIVASVVVPLKAHFAMTIEHEALSQILATTARVGPHARTVGGEQFLPDMHVAGWEE
jgi:hypothetical protein